MPDKMPRDADTQGGAETFDQDPVREAAFDLLGQSCNDLAEQGVLERIQEFEHGWFRSELRQQSGIDIRIPEDLNEARRAVNDPNLEVGRKKRKCAGRDRTLPIGSLLDLDERRRELIKRQPNPVAGTQPYAFAVTPVVGYNRDGTPGLDARDF